MTDTELPQPAPAPDLRFVVTVSSNRVWLAASRRVRIRGEEFRLVGYLPESCLGQAGHWRRRPEAGRQTLEQAMLAAQGAHLEAALDAAVAQIDAFLAAGADDGLRPDLRGLRDDCASGRLEARSMGSGSRGLPSS